MQKKSKESKYKTKRSKELKSNLNSTKPKTDSVNFVKLDPKKPIWMLPGEWWNSPEAIDAKKAKQLFPKENFGQIENDKSFQLFDHRNLEQHIRPFLKDDRFEIFFKQEEEPEEKGEEVIKNFLKAKNNDISTRRIPEKKFKTAKEFLTSFWKPNTKAKKPVGGIHISRISKGDFPIRVTAFPRPLFLDFGYPLPFSFLSNLIQLEVKDYILEVENIIKRSKIQELQNAKSALEIHKIQHQIRQQAADIVTQETGQNELLLRNFPLIPLLKREEAVKKYRIFEEDKNPWITFASEDALPLHYSNDFTKGNPRPSFMHVSQKEKKRLQQLHHLNPKIYDNYYQNYKDFVDIPQNILKEFRQNIQLEFEKIFQFSQQINNQRKYKLTNDEIEYFGFNKSDDSSSIELESFKAARTPQVFEKWKLFVEESDKNESDFKEDSESFE